MSESDKNYSALTRSLVPWRKDCANSTAALENKRRAVERELSSTKWFDYRFVTPWMATALFRKSYHDIYHHKFKRGIEGKLVIAKIKVPRAEMTSLWKARQFADQLGVPYEVFITAAFTALLVKGRRRKPRVNEFIGRRSRDKIVQQVGKYWKECRQREPYFSRLPVYREESFRGLPAQIEHRAWVLGELQTHANDRFLAEACLRHRLIREEDAAVAFGVAAIDGARTEALRHASIPVERATLLESLRSCYSLPGAYDGLSKPCQDCDLFQQCPRGVTLIQKYVKEKYGSESPADSRRLRLQRRRAAKFRAKSL